MKLVKSTVLTVIVILSTLCLRQQFHAQAQHVVSASLADLDESREHHPSRVLVRFRNGLRGNFLRGSGAAVAFAADANLFLVPNPPGLSVAETVGRYRANPEVLYAEPDYVVAADSTPTDPRWNQQWDMVKISAPTAWSKQTDSGSVVVAIIDSGIDFTHPDLQANLWVNSSDGSHGFDCTGGKCAKGGMDDFGHGTHVAGTIGAAADNGIGIAGLNWRIQLLSVKFITSNGNGFISDAVNAFDKVTSLKQQGVNIRLTNNSWGGGGFSQALKDAMSRAEAAGIAHVCAAGNNGQNADSAPMYPAAYDNRGIISVLASDQNDMGAGFTNYGIGSVDIAAPGVSTISTVPTGACPLCDPAGYKLLSGTSMATPHVTGVLAALFHENPALTANQARDVLLDPQSYDAVKDSRAQSTSTGGRLNFAKALSNPRLSAPVLNNFPTLAIGPNPAASAGGRITLTASVSDKDNDPLRMLWARRSSDWTQWLFGWMTNSLFANLSGTSVSFTAPSFARTATVPYDASVADGRGGSAQAHAYVTVTGGSAGLPPSGTLDVSPTNAAVGSQVNISFPVTDPEGGPVAWAVWLGGQYVYTSACCFTTSATNITFNAAGVYRVSTQAIDASLRLSQKQSVVVRIGGATGEPPIVNATVDTLSGPAPLKVNVDASASMDPDGSIKNYYFDCGNATLARSRSSQFSCSFSTPGVYGIRVLVEDNSGFVDAATVYAVATP